MRFKLRVGKKVLSFLLMLTMVLGVLPCMSITANAANNYSAYVVTAQEHSPAIVILLLRYSDRSDGQRLDHHRRNPAFLQ